MRVLATISTKGRYFTTLPMAIMAVAFQTKPPEALYIFDDNEEPFNLTTSEIYRYLLMQLDIKGIKFRLIFGSKTGQHYNHQWANRIAKEEGYDLIWRLDDDTAPEPNVLENLTYYMTESVGAIAGSILTPPIQPIELNSTGKMNRIKIEPNIQWGIIKSIKPVDHLHCSYLHRVGISEYNLKLSRVAYMEEALHSWGIKKKGYELLVIPNTITWHYKNSQGGTRTHDDYMNYQSDERIFDEEMKKDGVVIDWKMVVLDCGLGDTWAFKSILPKLKLKHKNITVACCYADVFFDEPQLNIISIQDAKNALGDIEKYNVYAFMASTNHKGSLIEAFEKIYKIG